MWKWIKALNPFAVELRNTEARLEFARVLLAQAEIELADKAFYVREFAAVSAERDGLQKRNDVQAEQLRRIDSKISPLMAELADLRERASVPVKVRFTCSTDEMLTAWEEANFDGCTGKESFYRDYLATRAVIDAPAGVDPPAGQVEALARVLQSAYSRHIGYWADWDIWTDYRQDGFRAEARAAIAHLAKRPEGLPTADQIKAAHMKYVEGYRKGENDGSMCATDFALEYLTPFLRMPMEANQ